MRSFPRAFLPGAPRRRLAAASVTGALALGVLVTPASPFQLAADDLKDRQQHVEKQIRGAAEHPRHLFSNSIQRSAGGVSRRKALGVRREGPEMVPFIGKISGLNAIDLMSEIRITLAVGCELFIPQSVQACAAAT